MENASANQLDEAAKFEPINARRGHERKCGMMKLYVTYTLPVLAVGPHRRRREA